MIHDKDKLLVSDELNGIISDEPPTLPGVVIATLVYDVGRAHLVGIVRSVLFSDEHEIEVEVTLDDAMALVPDRSRIVFDSFELKTGTVTDVTCGPFQVSALRVSDINAVENTCILGLLLKRPSSDLITG